ncbi:hypothetical protein CO667_26665 [Rhizobium sp. L43]|nr:hypothetical protein CO667_26665 [Rhizobium sp. L43]
MAETEYVFDMLGLIRPFGIAGSFLGTEVGLCFSLGPRRHGPEFQVMPESLTRKQGVPFVLNCDMASPVATCGYTGIVSCCMVV